MMKIFTTILFAAVVAATGFAQAKQKQDKDLTQLVAMMTGSFSSEEQSKADKDVFHIELHMTRIWQERRDGYWLYVEQAAAETPDRPYRQRIYHVFRQDRNAIISKVYEVKEPERLIGGWRTPRSIDTVTDADLIERQGCEIALKRNADGSFYGSTPGKECLSTLRGASYATSEVTIHKDKLVTWDRGWDSSGKQVWGAVKGGYIFKRVK